MPIKKMNYIILAVLGVLLIFSNIIETTLTNILGISLVVVGVLFIVLPFINKDNKDKKFVVKILEGIISLVLGILILTYETFLFKILGAWFVVISIAGISNLIRYKTEINNKFKVLLIIQALVGIFGIFAIFNTTVVSDVVTQIAGIVLLAHSIVELFICPRY